MQMLSWDSVALDYLSRQMIFLRIISFLCFIFVSTKVCPRLSSLLDCELKTLHLDKELVCLLSIVTGRIFYIFVDIT